MISVNLIGFQPNAQWLLQAQGLTQQLLNLPTIAEKNQLIDDNRAFWGQIKNELPFRDKCWYSEAKESVSIYEIEHFRPIKATTRTTSLLKGKNRLNPFEETRRDWTAATRYRGVGYWWLAFDFRNYRNCGKQINGIKSTRFPLNLRSFIAYSEADDYTREEAILLDPTRPGDPELLTFEPDGKTRPSVTDITRPEYIRATVSIEVYGLNKIDSLVTHRETKWSDCNKAIKRALNKYVDLTEAETAGNMADYYKYFDEFMDFIENDIKPAINPTSEFSAVAKACIMSYSKYEWINDYVLTA